MSSRGLGELEAEVGPKRVMVNVDIALHIGLYIEYRVAPTALHEEMVEAIELAG